MICQLALCLLHYQHESLNSTNHLLCIRGNREAPEPHLHDFLLFRKFHFVLHAQVEDALRRAIHIKMRLPCIFVVHLDPFAPHTILKLKFLNVCCVWCRSACQLISTLIFFWVRLHHQIRSNLDNKCIKAVEFIEVGWNLGLVPPLTHLIAFEHIAARQKLEYFVHGFASSHWRHRHSSGTVCLICGIHFVVS